MNQQDAKSISVIEPISQAIEKTKQILFNPFDMSKWFAIGFCAWLANLCQGGGSGGGGNYRSGNFGDFFGTAVQDAFANYLPLIITVGSILAVLFIALMLVCLWLSSRGRFMFLHCVANNIGEVKRPWHKFREQGNSLFLFRLCFGLLYISCLAVMACAIAVPIVIMKKQGNSFSSAMITYIVLISLASLVIMIFLSIISKFTSDFVVPIMHLGHTRCLHAWKVLLNLLAYNKWNFTVYILFQILLALCVGAISVAISCIAGCFACCLLIPAMIPIIGMPFLLAFTYVITVALLPILVFCRSYSLLYFAQYGPEFDVFFRGDDISDAELVIPELPQQ